MQAPGQETSQQLLFLAWGEEALTCFIRSRSKGSRAMSLTLPAGFTLGGEDGTDWWVAGPAGASRKSGSLEVPDLSGALPMVACVARQAPWCCDHIPQWTWAHEGQTCDFRVLAEGVAQADAWQLPATSWGADGMDTYSSVSLATASPRVIKFHRS